MESVLQCKRYLRPLHSPIIPVTVPSNAAQLHMFTRSRSILHDAPEHYLACAMEADAARHALFRQISCTLVEEDVASLWKQCINYSDWGKPPKNAFIWGKVPNVDGCGVVVPDFYKSRFLWHIWPLLVLNIFGKFTFLVSLSLFESQIYEVGSKVWDFVQNKSVFLGLPFPCCFVCRFKNVQFVCLIDSVFCICIPM